MTEFPDVKLESVDPEDIEDILIKLEKSFGITFHNRAFEAAETFGDICDVFERHIHLSHQDTCTTQQAFYKVRRAISQTLSIDEKSIELTTNLQDLFPRKNRSRDIQRLQEQLGIPLDLLRMNKWLFWTIFFGFLFSLITLFFDWRIAVSGLALFNGFSSVADLFAKEWDTQTVRELTEQLVREHYLAVRSQKGTFNRNEISGIIQNTFSADLELDKSVLTRDASLGWN